MYFGTDSSPDSDEFQTAQTGTSYAPGTLEYNTKYYWLIVATNGGGMTQGDTWSFTTADEPVNPPSKATSPSPANGASGVDVNADLGWANGGGATSYDVYFGTDSTPDGTESKGNQPGASYDPGALAYNTTYYWRIDAVNGGGTTSGDVWSFTTASEPVNPPTKATSPSPADGAVDQDINVNLSWANGGGATSYNVYFNGQDKGNQQDTIFDPGPLDYGMTYQWRIDAVNDAGTTTGYPWSFTTEQEAIGEAFPGRMGILRILSNGQTRFLDIQPNGLLVWSNTTPGSSGRIQVSSSVVPGWTDVHSFSSAERVMNTQLAGGEDAGEFMVVDLRDGPSASSYPVTYLNAVPPGGWTDEYKTTKLVLRKIPAGSFTMGSPAGELGRDSDEPQHSVTLTKDFYIGVFEVTQKQWERVMGNWPSYFYNATYRDSRPVERVTYYEIRENPANSAISPNWPQSDQVHAGSFMGMLRAKTGLAFDLPTEAQWEYACRAGTTNALNSGFDLTNTVTDVHVDAVGRHLYNGGLGYSENGDVSVGSAKVGSYLPNAWGLYDMHGNVWEWCLDWYGIYPGAVSDPPGEVSGEIRTSRGGSWYYYAWYCRSAARSNNSSPGTRFINQGFRLSRTLP